MYWNAYKLLLVSLLCFALAPVVRAGEADDQFSVAAGHYSAKRWDLAIEEFDRYLKEFPDHAKREKALFFYGEALVQRGRYADAYGQFVEVLAESPNSPYAKQALFRAGEAAYMSGRGDEARMRMLQFQAKFPEDKLNAHILLYQAEMNVAGGNLAEATRLYQQLAEQYGELAVADEGRLGLVDVLRKQRSDADPKDSESIEKLLQSVAKGTNSPWTEIAILQLAAARVEAADHTAALELYQSLGTRFPDSSLKPHATLGLGRALYQLKRYPEARKTLESLVSHRELGPDARYWLALTDKAEKNWQSAAERLSPALAGETTHTSDTAKASTRKVEDKAAPVTTKADARADDGHRRRNAAIRFHAAESLIRAGDFERAMQMLEDIDQVAGDVQSLANRYLLAVALQGLKRHDEALSTLNKLLVDIETNLAETSKTASPKSSELTAYVSLRGNVWLAKGRLLALQQRFEEAIDPLEAYWAQSRDNRDAMLEAGRDLAVCLARTNRLTQAKEVLAQLRANQLDKATLLTTTYHVAESAYTFGDYSLAAELFECLVQEGTTPETIAKGLSGLGWSQFQLGNHEGAAKTFTRFVKDFANDSRVPDAAFARAQALERLGQDEEALAGYAKWISHYSDSKLLPQVLLAQARLADRLGQDKSAVAAYERIVREFGESPEVDAALYGWAWAMRDLGDERESLLLFRRLHKEFPHSRYWPDTAYRLAEHAWRQGDRQSAAELLKPILCEDAPAAVIQHALYLVAQIAISEEHWNDAEIPLRKLIESYPDSALRLPAEFWFAESAYRRGDMTEASKRFDELAKAAATKQDRWFAIVPTRRAQLLVLQKNWTEARGVAETVARDYPDFDQLYEADYVIGRCFAAEADFEKARAAYRKVITSTTGSKTETAAKAQWMIGESYFHQENYATALREYLRVEILYPYPQWQAAALLQAGKCHERMGQSKEAAEIYSELMTKYGKSDVSVEAASRLKETIAR